MRLCGVIGAVRPDSGVRSFVNDTRAQGRLAVSQKERSGQECLIGRLRGEIAADRLTELCLDTFIIAHFGLRSSLTRISVVVLGGSGGSSGGGRLGHGRSKVHHLEAFNGDMDKLFNSGDYSIQSDRLKGVQSNSKAGPGRTVKL